MSKGDPRILAWLNPSDPICPVIWNTQKEYFRPEVIAKCPLKLVRIDRPESNEKAAKS